MKLFSRYRRTLTVVVAFLAIVLVLVLPESGNAKLIIEGYAIDSNNQAPIPRVTVRVLGTALSTLANDDGHFRLVLENGNHRIKITHIGYYSDSVDIDGRDTTVMIRLPLTPAPVELRSVTVRPRMYDPAQEIIRQAIKRKKDILARLHDYTCEAYSRVNVHDNTKPDSALFLITETRTTCLWEQPDKYKEIITARRQSANMKAQDNLMSIGQVLNFNRNRIELGRYAIVSPTATDALDHYDYYLLDTIVIDGRPVFVLELEPKSKITPLFVGHLQIADSSFDVVAVDVGFNEAVDFSILINPRYTQRHASLAPDIWMPVEIRFTGDVKLNIPFPGIPKDMSFTQLASLSDYKFDQGIPKGTFDEYIMEVAPTADKKDSTVWQAEHVIPLSDEETLAYHKIDSVERLPKPILKQAATIIPAAVLITTFGADDFFRYSRVEGAYLGAAVRPTFGKLTAQVSGGYAFSAERWQGSLGLSYPSSGSGTRVGLRLYDQIARRPALITTPEVSSTFEALWFKFDGLDYYRERGGAIWAEIKPVNHTRLRAGLKIAEQTAQVTNTDFSIFRNDLPPRENPTIIAGDMRSTFATFTYDSRKRIKTGRSDQLDFAATYLRIALRADWSSPDFLKSDFDFARYEGIAQMRFRPPIPGLTSIRLAGGVSTGAPPVQSWFVVDYGTGGLFDRRGYVTLDENNFVGSSAASVTLEHSFGRRSFALTRIPLVDKLPFSLSVRAGAFWTDVKQINVSFHPNLRVARTAYTEAGFALGNLTPFLSPFNLQMWFNWQLSAYDTKRLSLGFDFAL
jgi:hypothetical protein